MGVVADAMADSIRQYMTRQGGFRISGQPVVRTSSSRALRASLRGGFSWNFCGSIINAATLWGVLTVLARLGDAEAVGRFVLAMSVAAPIMALAMLQLRVLVASDASREYAFRDYFGLRIAASAVSFFAILIIASLSGWGLETGIVVVLVGLAKFADSLSDVMRGLFQREERMDFSGMSLIVRGPTSLLAVGITMWFSRSVAWTVAAMAVAWFVSFFAYDAVRARRLLRENQHHGLLDTWHPRFAREALSRLVCLAFPLGIVMGIISLQTNIPRYALQVFQGEEAVGYFGALAYPMAAVGMASNAMGQTASPLLARLFLTDLASFKRLVWKLSALAACLGILLVAGVLLFGRVFLSVYGAGYSDYQASLLVLSVATAIQLIASCWGYALTAARSLRIQVPIVITSSLLTGIAAVFLVPRWGVQGAAFAAVATSLSMLGLFSAATFSAIRKRMLNLAHQNSGKGLDGFHPANDVF